MTPLNRSLRFGLLLRLGTALVLLLALDAFACYATALYFANLVYDRWLIDSAHSLEQAVRRDGDHAEFDLSSVGLRVFQFDDIDHTYFRIRGRDQGFIAGNRDLPTFEPDDGRALRVVDARFRDQSVRLVTSAMPASKAGDVVFVEVAETLSKRAMLTRDILLAMVAPQVALLSIALLLAWFGVSRGLKPLTDLAAQIEARGHDNLSPVTERDLPREARVLAARINELLARVENVIRLQKRFVADAAHQLRTPLAAISLHAERLTRAVGTPAEETALNAVLSAVERAARLSRQLLLLARAEADSVVITEFKSIDLSALARTVGEQWIAQALRRNIDFGLAVPETAVDVDGDQGLLGEMLSNLIDNALRYTPDGGRVTVSVTAEPRRSIAVEDSGPGIPLEERAKVGERFYRIPGTSGEGSGLGLAIVKDIAALHRAEVKIVEGEHDAGTRVIVQFP